VLVTDLTDVRYLSGFSGSNGALLVLFDEVVLATDGRYRLQAQREAPAATLIVTRQLIAELLGHAGQRGVSQIGFGAASMSVATWQRIAAEFPDVSLVASSDVDVSGLRAVKDDEELASVRAGVCRSASGRWQRLLDEIRVGMGEIEIARRLELLMGLEGAPDRSFDSIVAGGPHSAIPHHQPTHRPIESPVTC
jgi:Xaa-Pro aminopeptidase